MFPLHDNIRPQSYPYVTYFIIAVCSLVYLMQVLAGENGDEVVERWGMIPGRVIADDQREASLTVERPAIVKTSTGLQRVLVSRPLEHAAVSDWFTLISCMFLHGGLMHFAGNMWFLHIFGDNVEDRLGHFFYLVMYLAAGIAAGVTHLYSDPNSLIPTIGASGAIAGVMGAYILLFPKAVVEAILPIPYFLGTFSVPAPIFLGLWFVLQIYNGSVTTTAGGGVAWWAHVGGFVAGALAAICVIATGGNNEPDIPRPVARRLI